MAKIAVHLAIFALLLLLANASIHTTIAVDNEENPWERQEGSCQEQIRQQSFLNHCQKVLKEQCSGGRCANPRQSRQLDSCCEQLKKLDRQCRCPGLKQAIQQQMQGKMGREEMQEMQQIAESIMSKCDVEPRRCDMQSRTTITLDGEENPRSTQGCRQQVQEQDFLRHCQKFIEEKRGGRSGSTELDSCCKQLEQLDRQCRCPGLKQAIQQQMPGQMGIREEMQQMQLIADTIMPECDVEPRRCDMRSPTTITLDGEENPRSTRGCREQIQEQDFLEHCQRFMEEQRSSRSCDKPSGSTHLDSCCEQLEQLDRQCRCPGLKQAMQQQFGQGQAGREEMHQIVQKIMSRCDVEPRRCDMPYRGSF